MKSGERRDVVPTPLPYDTAGWRWGIVIGYATGIFLFSSIPGSSMPSMYLNDKLIHASEFGLFGVLLARALRLQKTTWSTRHIVVWSILAAIAYGATDEWHQSFVPQRSADLADLVADGVGAILAVWGWSKVGIRWPRLW